MLHQNNDGMQKPGAAAGSAMPTSSPVGSSSRRTGCAGAGLAALDSLEVGRAEVAPVRRAARRPRRSASTDGQLGQHAARAARSRATRRRRVALRRRRAAARRSSVEVAAPRPPQRGQMRADAEPLAEIVRERPDVETGRAVDARASRGRRRRRGCRGACAVTLHRGGKGRRGGRAGVEREASADASAARARQPVAAPSVDLLRRERRRLLQERAAERVERARRSRRATAAARRTAAPIGRALRVARVGREAEADDRVVATCRWRSGTARAASRGRARAAARRSPAGSSVPVWPMRRSPSARRTRATTSCEVGPAGLSTTSRPSIDRAARSSRRTVCLQRVDRRR